MKKLKYKFFAEDEVGYLEDEIYIKIKNKVESYLKEVDPLVLKLIKDIRVKIQKPKITRKESFGLTYFKYPVKVSFDRISKVFYVSGKDYVEYHMEEDFWDKKLNEFDCNGKKIALTGAQ